jgi:hypothetical protein
MLQPESLLAIDGNALTAAGTAREGLATHRNQSIKSAGMQKHKVAAAARKHRHRGGRISFRVITMTTAQTLAVQGCPSQSDTPRFQGMKSS